MRIGRYELLDRLGAGGMGEVFRARDADLGREVAIKVLPPQFASDPARLARFSQEARAASSLNHPNIVTIHEIGQASGLPFIVMECVEGATLRQLLRTPLPAKKVLDLAVQLAEGLAKAHQAGIVHRDLKPENVMVTTDGFVKILDFGLAKLREAPPEEVAAGGRAADADTRVASATLGGAVLGTAGYMSPEQAAGRDVDYRSDQFSLGTVLYELATGRRAFAADSFVQTLSAIIEREPEPIASLNPAFPAPACWAIERCLSKDRADRYASTRDLAGELRSVRDHLSEPGTDVDGISSHAGAPAKRLRSWHAALAVALVIAGILLAGPTRDAMVRWLRPAPAIPDEMRVAVLPISVAPGTEDDAACCAGLLDYIVVRLSDLNRVSTAISVVPASEVLEAGVNSPSAAYRVMGATVAVGVSVHRAAGRFVVSASLADAREVRQLNGDTQTYARETFSPEAVAELVVQLLRVQWDSRKKEAWSRNAPSVPEAGALFAQGLGETPYQQARNALQRYEQEKSLQRAIDLFNRAIDLDPRYAAAHAGLGEARLRLYRLTKHPADLDLALASLTKALAIDDTRPTTWIALGMLHAEKGQAAEAEKAFAEAIARNPLNADAHRELGLAYERAGRPSKAEAALRKAIALRGDSWANHNALGYFFYQHNRLPDATAEFQKAVALAPDNPRAWSNLGGIALAGGRSDEAEAAFKAALRIAHYAPALSNLGTMQFRAGRFTEAARTFEQAAEAAPRDATIWRNLGSAYYHAPGERDRAAAAYDRAIALFEEQRRVAPNDAAILVGLGDSYAMRGQAAAARQVLRQALAGKATAGDLAEIASAFEHIGDRNAALRAAEAALRSGLEPAEIDRDAELTELRKDPRYRDVLKRAKRQPR